MTNSAKLNLILLPLFVSILLSTAGKLKLGIQVNSFVFTILSPITRPLSGLHLYLAGRTQFIQNLSHLEKENRDQKNQIAHLISQNEYLKQSISDKKILDNLGVSYHAVVPVHLSGSAGKFIATSSLPLDAVKPGQPLVSGNILLGTVREIKGNSVTITPLDSEKSPVFPARTSSGQKGLYKFSGNSSQIVDVPSQFPLILGDMVLTDATELFPGNLIIGKTTRLMTISQEPLQKAEINLYDTLDNSPDNLTIITSP